MIETIDLQNILFLDIETVPQQASYEQLDETFRELWRHKSKSLLKSAEEPGNEAAAELYERAGIYAEFGKIVCISVGVLARDKNGSQYVRLKSFAGHDERKLLEDFTALLQHRYYNPSVHFLCGHNIREFDIPYICRRMVVHQMPLPVVLDLYGKKPWETKHLLDTMELWKFGDNKSFTSIKLLAAILGFPSPKDDIDGSMVGRVYWEENDVARIAHYCEKDVLAVVQLLLRLKRMPLLEGDQIVHVSLEGKG